MHTNKKIISVRQLSVMYGNKQALSNVTLDILEKQTTALIGPSGCGKSTFLRCLNRMNDLIENCRITGDILFQDLNINSPKIDLVFLRSRIGMVFQKPNPFPKSIFENVAYGVRIHRISDNKTEIEGIVEHALERSGLWNEVKDRLHTLGTGLSGGQQQRLCIARAIAIQPQVILMDEPCSALDPIATAKIEELISELKQNFTIIIVTHSMQQASRISEYVAFFYMGELVEADHTGNIFTHPKDNRTNDYITGRSG